MNLIEVEEVYTKLSIDSSSTSRITTKKFAIQKHFYFMSSEIQIPIFLVKCGPNENTAITKLALDSLNIFIRKLKIDQEEECNYLVISLRKLENAPIFFRVIESILHDFEIKTGDTYTLCVLNLKRWKSFWDMKANKGLNEKEIIGLYGELLFLKNTYDSSGKWLIDRWTGPLGSEHDFILTTADYEIKSTLSSEVTISVSSLRQLEVRDSKKLYLVVYELGESDSKSLSLKDLVYYIDSRADADEQDIFWRRLTKLGYRLDEEHVYQSSCFEVVKNTIYFVREGFPSLTNFSLKSPLDSRIRSVNYTLELKDLEAFVIEDNFNHLKSIKA